MVYSSDILNTFLEAQGPNSGSNTSSSSAGSSTPAVIVTWNDKGLHTQAGPTPFVDISYSSERNGAGGLETYTTKITLTGKIVRVGQPGTTALGSGVKPVVEGISGIKNIFKDDIGVLGISCGGSKIFEASGARVTSMDFSKTNDNWVSTADYTITVEATEPAMDGFFAKNTVDSWNIEPLEDYVYGSTSVTSRQKQEYHNPKLKPTAPTPGAMQPSNSQTGGANNGTGAWPTAETSVNILSIPRFKISRNVSAIGLPSGSGKNAHFQSYLNAKKWVDSRLQYGLGTYTPISGLIAFNKPGASWPTGFLYNHLRSINFSITEGKYENTDTWLAMPTGILYTEDYTIELSTDDRYIHTVRVQGEINGLSIASTSAMSGGGVTTDSAGVTTMDLDFASGLWTGSLTPAPVIPDLTSQASAHTSMAASKYSNAISGWLNDIKPYLYRRACIAMSSNDRDRDYILSNMTPPGPPANPIYARLGVLNIIPVSTSEGHNTRKGSISYSYEFNNKFTIISGAISENITINDTGPTDVIGEAFVLGRALGPILQNLGTKTSSKKDVTVEVSVLPPSSLKGFFMQNSDCPLFTGGTIFQQITGIIEGLKPFGDRPTAIFGSPTFQRSGGPVNAQGQVFVSSDNQSWDPTNGKYTKSVSWVYQQCTNAKHWMDH